jgi:hypothetical protein
MAVATFIPNDTAALSGVPYKHQVELAAANGAITSVAGGHVHITKAGVCALTLAAPYADGAELIIVAETAYAHTVTVASAASGGGSGQDVGTFGGAINDSCVLVSRDSKWWVVSTRNVTFA